MLVRYQHETLPIARDIIINGKWSVPGFEFATGHDVRSLWNER